MTVILFSKTKYKEGVGFKYKKCLTTCSIFKGSYFYNKKLALKFSKIFLYYGQSKNFKGNNSWKSEKIKFSENPKISKNSRKSQNFKNFRNFRKLKKNSENPKHSQKIQNIHRKSKTFTENLTNKKISF